MIKGLTTVIVTAYNGTRVSAHITMACLANITKYTDPEDYELILIEDVPLEPVRDDYHVLKIDKHIVLEARTNYATKMNLAAKEANGEYLAFIQNDCFVWEGWLPKLRYYLKRNLVDCIIPDQFPRDRKFMKEAMQMSREDGLGKGAEDACMLMITAQAFAKTGGYNEKLEALVDGDFYTLMGKMGVSYQPTNKVAVTHITLATHYQDMVEFERKLNHDYRVKEKLI